MQKKVYTIIDHLLFFFLFKVMFTESKAIIVRFVGRTMYVGKYSTSECK